MTEVDLASRGFGQPWGHTRSYSNRVSGSREGGNGNNWFVKQMPQMVFFNPSDPPHGAICVFGTPQYTLWFDYNAKGDNYVGRFGIKQTLQHDEAHQQFVLTSSKGQKTVFYYGVPEEPELDGKFKAVINAAGYDTNTTYDTRYRLQSVVMTSDSDIGSYYYEYYDDAEHLDMLKTVTYKLNGTNVRRSSYQYYASEESYGNVNDLKTVIIEEFDPVRSRWAELNRSCYRYYKAGETKGFAYGLKYVVGPEAYSRMLAASLIPETAGNEQIAAFADNYFEYEGGKLVTLENTNGGTNPHSYTYETSTLPDGYNRWRTKTVETLPDGSQNIVYSNYAGMMILKIFVSGSSRWYTYYQYGTHNYDHCMTVLEAESSAIQSCVEPATLDDELQVTLQSNLGLIHLYDYYDHDADPDNPDGAAKGYLHTEKVQQGSDGTPVTQRETLYTQLTVGTSTIHPVWKTTDYQSSEGGGSQPATTSFDYEWYYGSFQIYQRTTTLPTVTEEQNGPGSSQVDQRVEIMDDCCSRVLWFKDERGFITRNIYDKTTGAVVQRVQDVDTTLYSDVPTGWTTPEGGGLNLVTDYENDLQGRKTQELGPTHRVDLGGTDTTVRRAQWIVYRDDIIQRWEGSGYATGTTPDYVLINPVKITQLDKQQRVTDEIQALRTGQGRLTSLDEFPQSSWVRWTKTNYDDKGLLTFQRVYFLIPEFDEGLRGTHYNQTDYGYDVMSRRNRVRTPGGTISRMIYHPCDWVLQTWVGTDDTGATDSDPSGASTAGNNMVKIQVNEYDNSSAGGDGNLTQQTSYENAMTTRVTDYAYDFRNRRVEADGEVDFYEANFYDNLDRVIQTDHRNTSSSGNLIARIETLYDSRERVYRTIRYGVDPSTGVIGNGLTDNTWYDAAGRAIKQQSAGSQMFQKTVYDGISRVVKRYVAYDLDENSYQDADDVADDTVMQQVETAYDDASNLIAQVTRDRFHDATGIGELTDPNGAQPKARVSYMAYWSNAIGRQIATANYGTNGAQPWTRPTTIPASSDLVLVNSTEYNDRGEVDATVDPNGIVTKQQYDHAGRLTLKIKNYVES